MRVIAVLSTDYTTKNGSIGQGKHEKRTQTQVPRFILALIYS